MMPLGGYHRRLVLEGPRSAAGRLIDLALRPAGRLYGGLVSLRNRFYDLGLLPVGDLPRPVIAVGNLAVGGTGKTPLTLWLARTLMARGCRVAVLSRGYGRQGRGAKLVSDGRHLLLGPTEAGDEPYLLARQVPGLMVAVGADRLSAARLTLSPSPPDLFLLDDAFQHRRVRRDLDIVLLDWHRPFGNGRVLPAGLLREPAAGLARADLVVLTRSPQEGRGPALPFGKPVCRVCYRLDGPVEVVADGTGDGVSFAALAGRRGLALAGIADPGFFFRGLEEEGLHLADRLAFSDHACFGPREIDRILERKGALRADYLIATEKDVVKLGPYLSRLQPLYTVQLELEVLDREVIEGLLSRVADLPTP